jgi:RimJ/RimL family protein N-acetyltransferase
MQLETERLVLRKPRLEDVDDVLELIEDDDVMQWIGGEAGDRDSAVEHVERWMSRWERNDLGPFSVLLDGHVIGRVGLLVWDTRTWETSSFELAGPYAQPELGWALAQRFWGHGYATEAARAAREWAYAERDVERLVSLIAPHNMRSARVAEKLGATPTDEIETHHGPARVWVHPR